MMDSFRGILSSAPEVMSLLSHSRFWQRCDVVAWEAIHRLHVESTVSFQSVTVSIRTIYTLYEHIGFMLFFVLLPFWLSWVLRSAMRVRFATIQPCPFDDVSCSYGENHIPTATSPIHLSGCPVPADSLSQRG